MVNSDIEFREETEYTGEQKYSIKELIIRHIRKISDICCKEFTGGYWEKKPIKTNSGILFTEVYHEDVRESYCNAIDFLIDVLYPMGDDKFKEYLVAFENYDKIVDKKNKKIKEKNKVSEELDIKEKLKLKRQTFRQINLMFDRNDFWKGTGSYNE